MYGKGSSFLLPLKAHALSLLCAEGHKGQGFCACSKEQQTLPEVLHLQIEMFLCFFIELPRACGSGRLGLVA